MEAWKESTKFTTFKVVFGRDGIGDFTVRVHGKSTKTGRPRNITWQKVLHKLADIPECKFRLLQHVSQE